MWQETPYGYGDGAFGWMHGGGHWLGFGLHSLFWILLVATIAIAVIWAARAVAHRHVPEPVNGSRGVSEILEESYARGEIDREEFLARKRDLGVRG